MLYIVGLGLDKDDISLKGINALKQCNSVYCEFFTSNWNGDIKNLEKSIGKDVTLLERGKVESDFLIKESKKNKIGLVVPGDPLTATTHFELVLEAKKNKIHVEIVHSSSIYTTIAETGLQLYKFGRTTTLPRPQDNFNPRSPLEVINENKNMGLHTLVLLDIGMTAKEALGIIHRYMGDEKVVACCCLGTDKKIIKFGKTSALLKEKKLDKSPAVLIIPGVLHFKEEEALVLWK